MEGDFFLNVGMPVWASAMEIEAAARNASEMNTHNNCSASGQSSPADCFFNPNNYCEKSTDHSLQFDSALSSMVSSPAASNSNTNHFCSSNDSFIIRELIGKLGNINGNNNNNCGSTNTSCYTTPLNSPPKLNGNLPITDHFVKEQLPFLGNSIPSISSTVADFPTDPGFADRAAMFSQFGSRSFNGRKNSDHHFGGTIRSSSNHRHHPVTAANEKLPRVPSSPSLKALFGSQAAVARDSRSELANSQEESSVSEQIPNRASASAALKPSNDSHSRKRKAKSKEPAKVQDKRCKTDGVKNASENGAVVVAKEAPPKGDDSRDAGDEKQPNKTNSNTKPPEPFKDYIHVRARRGQATDSHSLAERVRREKISERMKFLQDLVPGCNKVTGKALMLDEIINYVQSLQRQVEFLSMKLSSLNTRLDFNVDVFMSKQMYQPNKALGHLIFPTDSSASAFFGQQQQQTQQNPAPLSNFSSGTLSQCPLDPSDDAALGRNLNVQDQFTETMPQLHNFCEDDLQSIVQMGFGQNPNRESSSQAESFHGSNQAPHTKIEL